MKGCPETLALIARTRSRRPSTGPAALNQLFLRLAAARWPEEAATTERHIWDVWMHHPHEMAARTLDLAAGDIAARRFDIAETRLSLLIRRAPDFAEAWHKRAVLYYMAGEDEACIADLQRALILEPRHFSAILHFAELLLEQHQYEDARFASAAALSYHPHLQRAKAILAAA